MRTKEDKERRESLGFRVYIEERGKRGKGEERRWQG